MKEQSNEPAETALVDINARAADEIAPEHEAHSRRHVGRSMERLEDPAILTGRGRYGDDIAVKPGTLHAAVCGRRMPTPNSWQSIRKLRRNSVACAPYSHATICADGRGHSLSV